MNHNDLLIASYSTKLENQSGGLSSVHFICKSVIDSYWEEISYHLSHVL
jgi:hypothetical protein